MLSGLANATVLVVINAGAASSNSSADSFHDLLLFLITIVIFILAQYYILVRSTVVVETVLNRIRLRLVDLIGEADLYPVERLGRSAIYTSISKEIIAISQATTTIIVACQSGLLILFSVIYLAVLSRTAFFIVLALTGVGISVHFQKSRDMQAQMHQAIRTENRFFDLLNQVLDGFKEMKLNRVLAATLKRHLRDTSGALTDLKVHVSRQFSNHFIFSQTAFYFMIAAVVFLLPKFNESAPEITTKATACILFIIGPLSALIGSIPAVAQANVAVANIDALEAQLRKAVQTPSSRDQPVRTTFEVIALRRVTFEYHDDPRERGFSLGPIDIDIVPGELVFIIGGNGSGKSTFLKLLTGLYYPKSGTVLVDRKPVGPDNAQGYRDLFGVIFSDYHLFDELYGAEPPQADVLDRLLREFELEGKVSLDGRRWSTTSLSTGQRKRLALIVNWIENKPIAVLDEWAADQDPHFRRYFYEDLLPEMKRRGRTVIAATHDDRYFHLADRVLQMEAGQLRPLHRA
jgi:putative ATP-binding cassette transporter